MAAGYIIALTLLFLALMLFRLGCHLEPLISLLKRLRWLLLSLFILHVWFNTAEFTWIPSKTNLWLAGEKTGVLIAIVFAAYLLLNTTPIQDITAALHWWFKPFKCFFSPERLAVRLVLILNVVKTVQTLYIDTVSLSAAYSPIESINEKLTRLMTQILTHAETTALHVMEVAELQSPPWWQWLYPMSILSLIWL